MENLLKKVLNKNSNVSSTFVEKFEINIKAIEEKLSRGGEIEVSDIIEMLDYYLKNEDFRVITYRDDALLNNVWIDYQKHGTIEFRTYVPLLIGDKGKIGFEINPFGNEVRDRHPASKDPEPGIDGVLICLRGNIYRGHNITNLKFYIATVGKTRDYYIDFPYSIRELSIILDDIKKSIG